MTNCRPNALSYAKPPATHPPGTGWRLAGRPPALGEVRTAWKQPRMAPPLSHPKKGGPGIAAPEKALAAERSGPILEKNR